jgi:hypothetical protein
MLVVVFMSDLETHGADVTAIIDSYHSQQLWFSHTAKADQETFLSGAKSCNPALKRENASSVCVQVGQSDAHNTANTHISAHGLISRRS